MRSLLSNSQLAAIQRVGESGMRVEVTIQRPEPAASSLGDGDGDMNPATVSQPASILRSGKLYGYLRQTGGDSYGGIDVGRLQTTSTYELGLPVGADVEARDLAIISGRTFVVQDVLDDETWPSMLNCVLRRGE